MSFSSGNFPAPAELAASRVAWMAQIARPSLPPAVQEAWVSALTKITAMPDVAARLVSYGFEPLVSTPAQFAERYQRDYPRTAQLIKEAGVTFQ